MATTISQRIELEGGEEIKRQLAAAGNAAGDMSKQMQAAALQASIALNKVVQAVANVEERFAALGASVRRFGQSFSGVATGLGQFETAVGRTARQTAILTGAITGAAAAIGLVVKNSADAADRVEEQAQALGISTEAFQAFELGAAQAGVSGKQFGTALARLSKDVEKEAAAQRTSLTALAKEFLQVGGKTRILPRTVDDFAQTSRVIENAAKVLQKQLAEVGVNEHISTIIAKLRRLSATSEEARKNIERIGGEFPALTNLEKLDDLLKGENAQSLQALGVNVLDVAGKVRPLEDTLGDLAEKFKEIGPGTRATALAIARFGQRVGPQLLPFLLQGREGVRGLVAEFNALQIGFDKTQLAAGGKLSDSFKTLGTALSGLKNQFGAQFFGVFQEGVDALTKALVGSVGGVKALGREISLLVAGPVKSLIGLFTGQFEDESQLEVADKWAVSLQKFKAVAVETFRIVLAAFRLLVAAAQQVANALNSVFGTKFSGEALLAAAAVLKFLGVFALVGAAVSLVARSLGLLVAGFALVVRGIQAVVAAAGLLRFLPLLLAGFGGPVVAAVVAGLALVAAAFLLTRDQIVGIWEGLKETLSNITTALFKLIITDILGVQPGDTLFSWLSRAWENEWAKIKAGAGQTVQDTVREIADIGTAAVDIWGWLKKAWDETWNGLKADAPKKLLELVQFITSFTPAGIVFGWIKKAWDEAWKQVTTGSTAAEDAAKRGVKGAQDAVQGALSGAAPALNQFTTSSKSATQALADGFRGAIKDSAALQQSVKQLNGELQNTQKLAAGPKIVTNPFFNQGPVAPVAPQAPIQASGISAFDQAASQAANVLQGLSDGASQFDTALDGFAIATQSATQGLESAIAQAAQGLAATDVQDALRQAADQLAQELQSVNVDEALRGVADASQQLDSALDGLASAAQSAESALESLDEGDGGFAGGGFVRGPGTTTSDSILARLSKGEFVVRAAAVQHFGPSFFAALNALRMPKFSMGGVVDGINRSLSSLAIPRFADGGLAVASTTGNRTPITLVMPDGRKVGGLFGTDTAINQLKREVVSQQVTSAGRKPDWVR